MNGESMGPRESYEVAAEKFAIGTELAQKSQSEMDGIVDQAQFEGETLNEAIKLRTEQTGDVEVAKDIILGADRVKKHESSEKKAPGELDLDGVEDFGELYKRIVDNEGLESSNGAQDATYWIQVIEEVRSGKIETKYLTSNSGLRTKVEELLKK